MSNRTIRMIIVLGAFVITGVFTVQMYWLQKAFSLQDKQFEQSVKINLSQVATALGKGSQAAANPFQSIEQLSSNYYILHVKGSVDTSILGNLMKKEFSSQQLKTTAEYAVYDSSTHQMLYGDFIGAAGQNQLAKKRLPMLSKGEYYIGLSFPNLLFRMNGEMYIWIFSTFLLIIFLLFFVYSLFVILKQKRLSEVQRDFVNNMTHEFKTPLSTISLIAETLESSGVQDLKFFHFIDMIRQEAVKLNTQVDKILLSGKSDSLKLALKKEKIDLHELVQEVVVSMGFALKGNCRLNFQFTTSDAHVMADKTYLTHAVQNLLDNAVKYSGNMAEIVVSTESTDGKILLSVADNGIGIDRKFQKQVFKPFFRVPTGNLHNVRGFGIGLHYVKSIVSAHRWKIALESVQGRGSRFTLQIPV